MPHSFPPEGSANSPNPFEPGAARTPSPADLMHARALAAFTEAFGAPSRQVGEATNWSLRRLSYVAGINVLLAHEEPCPVVWVFDPHDPTNGVTSHKVREEADITRLVEDIRARVKRAGNPLK